MAKKKAYTTKLSAGLGLIDETKTLLNLWEEGLSVKDVHQKALRSGLFSNIAARRLLNIVKEVFSARYLVDNGRPAMYLKAMLPTLNSTEFQQFVLLYTCRANVILADFIRQIYWEKYSAGYSEITQEDSRKFVENAIDRELTTIAWSETIINRASSNLMSCCADFNLLESGRKSKRKILPFRISPKVFVYLAYDLHFSGIGDNSLLENEDWKLFGLDSEDVLNEMKRIAPSGHFIVQSAGNAVRIGWQYKDFEEVINGITRS